MQKPIQKLWKVAREITGTLRQRRPVELLMEATIAAGLPAVLVYKVAKLDMDTIPRAFQSFVHNGASANKDFISAGVALLASVGAPVILTVVEKAVLPRIVRNMRFALEDYREKVNDANEARKIRENWRRNILGQ